MESQTLLQRIASLSRRLTLVRAARYSAAALTWGMGSAAVLVLAHKLYLIACPPWLPVLVLFAAGCAAAWWTVRQRATPFEAACLTDETLGLKERLSSAVALLRLNRPLAFLPALVADATAHAQDLEPRRVYPFRFDRTTGIFCAATVAAAASLFLPEMDWLLSARRRAIAEAIRAEGRKVEEVAKELERRARRQDLRRSQAVARRLAELGREMQNERLAKKEALKRLGKLSDELKASQEQLAKANIAPKMEEAATKVPSMEMQSDFVDRLKADLMQRELRAASKQLKDLKQKLDSGQLSQSDMKKIAEDLKKLGDAMRKAGLRDIADKMDELAKALREGDVAKACKLANQLSSMMRNASQIADEMAALSQLAEDLKDSEVKIAQSDTPCPECEGTGKCADGAT